VSVVATGIEAEKIAQPRPQAASTTLSVVSGGRKVMAPAAPAPAGLSAQARQPTDYHHTLVASPPHPGAVQGHAAQGYPVQGQPAQGQPVQSHPGHTTVGNTVRTYVEQPQHHVEPAPVSYAPQAEPVAPPAPMTEAQPVQYQGELAAPQRGREQDRVTGPLRGQNQDGSFIAPRPADGGPRQQNPSLNTERFIAPTAALPESAPKKRGSSLFERVTGIGRRIMEGSDPEPQQVRQTPQPQAQAPVRQAPAGAPQQQRPAESLERPAKMSHAEEEMLDIPAFLRRQAN
jgi:cell division protein FtsZ